MKHPSTINIRLPESESEVLRKFCIQEDRSQTDVLREFVRSLKPKLKTKNKHEDRVSLEELDVSELPCLSYCRKNQLPPCRAVYFVITLEGEILYVGMTKNLKARWKNHGRAKECLEECKDIKIAWIENPEKGFIWFEKEAISKYLPPINRRK